LRLIAASTREMQDVSNIGAHVRREPTVCLLKHRNCGAHEPQTALPVAIFGTFSERFGAATSPKTCATVRGPPRPFGTGLRHIAASTRKT
jgi:hypothetical protein